MKAIGIDIGTTSICGVLIDAESGDVIQTQSLPSDAFISTEHDWEKVQDVSKIVSIAAVMLDSFLKEFPGEICAIGLTGQMHGILYLNAEGRAVSPLYTWQDGRGNLPYKGTTYASYLGCPSGYGNVTDFYNRENRLVPHGASTYCTVHAYFGMLLCRNEKPILHASDAASLGLYDLQTGSFAYEHCNVAVTDKFDIIGTYKGIPVSVAIGDNQASVLATLGSEDGLLINVGTGSQISIVSDHPITAECLECRPYVEGKYLIVGAPLCGGRAFSILKDFYHQLFLAAGCEGIDVYGVMDRMLKQEEDCTLCVDTRFAGTRQNPDIRGSIANIGTENFTPRALTVGVLRGMANELYGIYGAMGEKRKHIVGSGGGIRKNKALVKIIEQTFGYSLRTPLYTEEAACGAALFSLVSIHRYSGTAELRKLIRF